MSVKTILFKFTLFILLTPLAHARWKAPQEADTARIQETLLLSIKKDGTYRSTEESLAEIKNEKGRASLGTVALTYNNRASTMKVLGAKTRLGSEVLPVSPTLIEDKPVATNLSGFDQINQIKISYPKAEVGAKVYLKTVTDMTEVPIAGHFDTFVEFGNGYIEENAKIVIESELPFEFLLSDPTEALEKKYELRGELHTLTVSQVKPIYHEVSNEESNAVVPFRSRTWLMVSTTKAYADLTKTILTKYEEIISQPLPDDFEAIRKAAQEKKPFVEAANTVTSMLADKLRYMGDWRPINGGHVPRSLAEIASTHFGDCKDMATVTTAILRRLGFNASVAWVYRSTGAHESGPLVNITWFNHAIVRVENDGRSYWLDPTNPSSFAQGIPGDIYDREAVVLDARNPHTEHIACPIPEDASTTTLSVLTFAQNGDANAAYDLDYNGSSAVAFAGSERNYSKKELQDNLTKYLSGDKFVLSERFDDFDLQSRIVRDIHFRAELGLKSAVSRSTAGFSYALSSNILAQFKRINPRDMVSDLLLGVPQKAVAKKVLKNVTLVGALPKPCSVDSPWFKASRAVRVNGDDLEIEEQLVYQSPVIPNSAIQSSEFARVQAELQDKFGEYSIIFTMRPTPDPKQAEASRPN